MLEPALEAEVTTDERATDALCTRIFVVSVSTAGAGLHGQLLGRVFKI